MQLSICRYRYEELDHSEHKRIHDLARDLNARLRYDIDWNFYKIIVPAEDWLMARLKDPKTTGYFRIYSE